MPDSLTELLLEHFGAHRDDVAIRQRRGYRTESFTYGGLLDMAESLARELERREIRKGDRVMLWGENSAEWVAAFLGCAMRGAVVVPMDDSGSADFALRVFRQVEAKLLIASRRHLRECASHSIATLDLEDLPQPDGSAPNLSAVFLSREDILEIVFTSGTTAEPKGVVITHGNVLGNLAPIEHEMQPYMKYERFVHPLRFLNLLPLSHVFGQFLGMFLPPLLGATVVFQDELKPSEVMSTILRERVSVLVSVPRVLTSLKQKIERDLEDAGKSASFRRRFAAAKSRHFLRRWWNFRGIRQQFGWKFWAFISGGAALDAETEEFWGRLGYAVIQGYGLTETTSLISVNHPFRLGTGSIGKVLPGREVKLADDGEILVRGAGVASAYWGRDRVADRVSDNDGWYRTGDIGALDAAGNLYFKGRKKEVIVTPAGMNVYPPDLEAALRRQLEVRDCVVVGIDRGGNAEPCAVLLLHANAGAAAFDAAAIVRRANESLAEYQRMNLWVEWPDQDFPRTSTGKPRKNLIREAAEAKILGNRAESVSVAANPLADLVARIAGRAPDASRNVVLRADALRAEAKLDSDLGLSSLDRVELLSAIEDRYHVDLSEARFNSLQTVGDLDRLLRGESSPGPGYHYPAWTLRWPFPWLRFLAYYLLIRPAIVLLGWPRIEGREHLRRVNGPLLVVANHIGDVDPGFILTALPARFRHRLATAAGGETLEALRSSAPGRNFFLRIYDRVQWILGVSLLNLFPLPRAAGFRRSFAYAGAAVDRGYNVLVFPEGRHTTDGRMNPFRAGIGLLAVNLAIPVLPMRIDGLFEVKQSGRKFAAPWKIRVRIGGPHRFAPDADPEKIAAELQQAVENLGR